LSFFSAKRPSSPCRGSISWVQDNGIFLAKTYPRTLKVSVASVYSDFEDIAKAAVVYM
jgi:hypothetical protein